MDRLAKNAMKAMKAGMSYGKWKALQPVVPAEEKPLPEGWLNCERCGKPFKKRGGTKRFCNDECRSVAYRDKHNAYMQQYREKKNKEAKDGEA